MKSIQQAGLEILNNQPESLYIFTGSEYGIKLRYIDALSQSIGPVVSGYTVKALVQRFSVKQMIPAAPSVYVIRYDDEFVSELSESYATEVASLETAGVVVMLFNSDKHEAKLNKFLPDHVVRVDPVHTEYLLKYLQKDFPTLSDSLRSYACELATDYYHAKLLCQAMEAVSDVIQSKSVDEISELFGHQTVHTQKELSRGIASRNFQYCLDMITSFEDNLESVIFCVFSTVTEIEKLLTVPNKSAELFMYTKYWTFADCYNMFMNAYQSLQRIRSITLDASSVVVQLLSLLMFSPVPAVEELT